MISKKLISFNGATLAPLGLVGIDKGSSIKVGRRRYSNNSGVQGKNRWWDKPSKAMPAPSTLRMLHLSKLATSSSEAREMLKLMNDMPKLKGNKKIKKNKIFNL